MIEACKVAYDALDTPSRICHIMMGTTMVMASVEGNIITIAHCGDSRCYLLRDGTVVCQTKDHADTHCGSESVTRCFFSFFPEAAVPDIVQFAVKRGDRIFLCSDGVYKVTVEQMQLFGNSLDKYVSDSAHIIWGLGEYESGYDGVTILIVVGDSK